MTTTAAAPVLDLLAIAAGPAFGLAAGLACIAMAWRASERALPAGGDVRTLRRSFALIAGASAAYAIALPLAIALLPRDAMASVVVTLSGGFAWMVAAQAVRLRGVARAAGLAVPAIAAPVIAMPAARAIGAAERWTGLGATLLGLGLAMAGALAGGLFAAFG